MKKLLLSALMAPAAATAHAQCPNQQIYNSATITASGSTQLIAAPGNNVNTGNPMAIHICLVTIQINQPSTPILFGLTAGTGTACATGTSTVTPMWLPNAITWTGTYGINPLTLPPSSALCLNLSAAPTGAVVHVQYSVY